MGTDRVGCVIWMFLGVRESGNGSIRGLRLQRTEVMDEQAMVLVHPDETMLPFIHPNMDGWMFSKLRPRGKDGMKGIRLNAR